MKQVWKCDYCCHIHEDESEVHEHEETCVCNPKNRNCYSCGHDAELNLGPWPTDNECAVNHPDRFKIEDEGLPCDKWTPAE